MKTITIPITSNKVNVSLPSASSISVTKPSDITVEVLEKGSKGEKGEKGDTGAAGAGFPTGGATGQYLVKLSGDDYDTAWTSASSDGLFNVVEDTTPQLGGALDTNNKNIEFGDSNSSSVNRLKFGASDDLQIYHGGGTINHIVGLSTHSTYITGGTDLYLRGVNGEEGVTINGNSSVELFHNNSKKFETTTGGVKVDGTIEFKRFSTPPTAFEGGMYADDNDNLYFGVSDS